MLIRRDSGEKIQVAISEIKNTLKQLKVEYYKSLYSKAENHLNSSIVEVSSIEELKDVINQGKIGLAYFGGDESDEKKIKELTTSTPRCIKEENVENQICFFTKKPAINKVYFARAY
jgi:prolyl-tRNA synthetase